MGGVWGEIFVNIFKMLSGFGRVWGREEGGSRAVEAFSQPAAYWCHGSVLAGSVVGGRVEGGAAPRPEAEAEAEVEADWWEAWRWEDLSPAPLCQNNPGSAAPSSSWSVRKNNCLPACQWHQHTHEQIQATSWTKGGAILSPLSLFLISWPLLFCKLSWTPCFQKWWHEETSGWIFSLLVLAGQRRHRLSREFLLKTGRFPSPQFHSDQCCFLLFVSCTCLHCISHCPKEKHY